MTSGAGMDGTGTSAPGSEPPIVCGVCGTVPPDGQRAAARLTWSRGSDGARTTWTCDRCSREHLRSIEGKLDPTWW